MRIFGVLFLSALFVGCAASRSDRAERDVTRSKPQQEVAKIIDVRTPEEYATGHLPGAINLPLTEIEQRIGTVVPDKSQLLVLHCHSGKRSAAAKVKLDRMGYTAVRDLGSIASARLALNLPKE